tara:strand:+ start:34 stop:873 length:840 start_codon:yes stop_codon:yes gene_type:complete
MEITQTIINSSTAGVLSKSIIAPLDRIKILYQTSNNHFSWKNGYNYSKHIIKKEGFKSLWRGNGIQVLRFAPYTSIAFTTQKILKKKLTKKDEKDINNINGFIVGALTGLVSSTIVYPFDTLRCCMATETGKNVKTSYVIKNIIKKQGILSLWRGISVSTIGILPYSSLAWGSFYILNRNIQKFNPYEKESHILRSIAIFTSVLFSQTIVYPIDVWRRRIQNSIKTTKTSNISILKSIISEKAFFKGVSINWLKTPFVNTLSFTLFMIFEDISKSQELQ